MAEPRVTNFTELSEVVDDPSRDANFFAVPPGLPKSPKPWTADRSLNLILRLLSCFAKPCVQRSGGRNFPQGEEYLCGVDFLSWLFLSRASFWAFCHFRLRVFLPRVREMGQLL